MENNLESTTAVLLLGRWSAFRSKRHQALQHDDVEVIHDLRVATRRLRAAVKLFAPFSSSVCLNSVYPVIRYVTRVVGSLRNLDEALLFIQNHLLDTDDDSLFESAWHSLKQQRNQEADKVHKLLKRLDIPSIQKNLEDIARHLPKSPLSIVNCSSGHKLVSYLSDYNLMLFNQVHANIEATSLPEAVDQRHQLRIAIKKWRYFLEILAELTNKDYSAILSVLKYYQSILGSLNDLSVFGELFNDLGLSSKEQAKVKQVTDKLAEELYSSFIYSLKHQPLRYEFLI